MSTSQRRETAGETSRQDSALVITWRAERFTLPRAMDFPLEALEAEEEGKHLTALKLILGAEQYKIWRALAATAADAEDFSSVVMKELGRGNL